MRAKFDHEELSNKTKLLFLTADNAVNLSIIKWLDFQNVNVVKV